MSTVSASPPPEPMPGAGGPGGGVELAELAAVGVYAKAAQGFERGLVVLSMGFAYWLVPFEGGYQLLVDRQWAGRVRAEIAHFDRESAGWPPRPTVERGSGQASAMLTPLLWALAVLAAFHFQTASGEARLAMDSRAVFQHGEGWRPFTALFLHADASHLTGNLISGFFVFTAVVATLGAARAWLLLALAGTAANLAVAAATYPAPYQSLGASTAIMAGFGLLTGRAIRAIRRTHWPQGCPSVLIPLASGVALLGWFGAGDGNTDVAAHLAGFAAGGLLGLGFPGRLPIRRI